MVLFGRSTAWFFCIAVFLGYTSSVVASDDAYLKLLEGEAEDLQLDESGQIDINEQVEEETVPGTDWGWEGSLEGDNVPKGLSLEDFSGLLQKHFYGTYVFYRKLSSVDRQTVYYHYSKADVANLNSIRQDILSQLKQ